MNPSDEAKMRKEFENRPHWKHNDLERLPRDDGYIHFEVDRAWMEFRNGYEAAAQSRDDAINELIAECRYYKDMLTGLALGLITHPVRPYSKSKIPAKTTEEQSRDNLIGTMMEALTYLSNSPLLMEQHNMVNNALKQATAHGYGRDACVAQKK